MPLAARTIPRMRVAKLLSEAMTLLRTTLPLRQVVFVIRRFHSKPLAGGVNECNGDVTPAIVISNVHNVI